MKRHAEVNITREEAGTDILMAAGCLAWVVRTCSVAKAIAFSPSEATRHDESVLD